LFWIIRMLPHDKRKIMKWFDLCMNDVRKQQQRANFKFLLWLCRRCRCSTSSRRKFLPEFEYDELTMYGELANGEASRVYIYT
jgi:hypothetical protein